MGTNHLIQAWTARGELVYERWTKNQVKNMHISNNILIYLEPDDQDAQIREKTLNLKIVQLDVDGDSCQINASLKTDQFEQSGSPIMKMAKGKIGYDPSNFNLDSINKKVIDHDYLFGMINNKSLGEAADAANSVTLFIGTKKSKSLQFVNIEHSDFVKARKSDER